VADARRRAEELRRAARARNKGTQADLARTYREAYDRIRARLDDLTEQIARARSAGEQVDQSWLLRQWRLRTLEGQVLDEMRLWSDGAARRITDEQVQAIAHGRADAAELIGVQMGPAPTPAAAAAFAPQLPRGALEALAGRMSDGTPIADYMARTIGPATWEGVRGALIEGVALGLNPREIARAAARSTGLPLARALVIARTETINAYREAARQTYAANPRTVTAWMWQATLDRRTCAVCWASHGEVHPPDEMLSSHPSCRCTMLPVTRTWAELGFPGVPETQATLEPGEDIFRRQSAEVQREVLGPGKFDAWHEGDFALRDLIVHTTHPVFGAGRRERALRELVTTQ